MLRPIIELCAAKIGVTERRGRAAGVCGPAASERRNGRARWTTRRSGGLRKLGREGGSRRDRIAVCALRRHGAPHHNRLVHFVRKALTRQPDLYISRNVCCAGVAGVAFPGTVDDWPRLTPRAPDR